MSRKPSLLAAAIAKEEAPASLPEQAAEKPKGRAAKPAAQAQDAPSPSQHPGYVAPSRASKKARTHFLHPDYWETLRELSHRSRTPQERLVAEALNDLFAKHNFPQVREG